MKHLASSYLWWLGLDDEIEETVKACVPCQSNRKMPVAAPLHSWEWPQSPWLRIYVDYVGLFLNQACAWFHEIAFVRDISMCVFVCARTCVHA